MADASKGAVLAAISACAAAMSAFVARPAPRLLWNASASSPVGLYWLEPPDRLRTGDMAVAWAPAGARQLAADRHYLPAGVPLLKRVAAVAGDRVCAKDTIISINGRRAAARRRSDPAGRPMPGWRGCLDLASGEVLLLSSGTPNAFDARYFGITRPAQIIAKARSLWRW